VKATHLKLTKIKVKARAFYRVTFPVLPKGRGRRTFKVKEEAEEFLNLKKIEIRNQGLASSTLTERQRAEYLDALELIKPFSISLREALKIALPHLAMRDRTVKVSEAVERLLASKQGEGRSHRYLLDLSSRLNAFTDSFGHDFVSSISPSHIEAWLVSLSVGPQTRNNYRRVVGTLLEYSARRGWREGVNPALVVPSAKVTRSRPAILTAEQLRALFEASNPRILPALAIGALAGLRQSEIQRLDWSEIKLPRSYIDVGGEKAKTGRRRLVARLCFSRGLAGPLRAGTGACSSVGISLSPGF
jgi:integrase